MIKFTWFGTASVLIEIDGEKLLFDPFFRMNEKLEQPDLDVFCNVDYIFNTHPHFDHLCDVPQILENSNAKLYGTATAYLRLETQGVDVENKVEILCPHESLKTSHAEIFAHRSKHIKNNLAIVLITVLRGLSRFDIAKAVKILKKHKNFLMSGDIVAFEVKTQGKTILLFGSAGIDQSVNLPKDVDVLVWPYQGRTNMAKYSLPIIEKINPKVIVLDHFDDSFPPITGKVNTNKFVEFMKKKHPEIKVIVPKYAKSFKL